MEPVAHLVDVAAGVGTITLNRPAAYNALTADMLDSLRTTWTRLAADPAVRAIVLTGAGKGFCSGQALDDERSLPAGDTSRVAAAVTERYNPLLAALIASEKPTVAAINGVAAGAGLGLALACDFRVVASDATFTTGFVKIGLSPDCGVSLLLPHLVGYGKALELCILAERFDAQRADALGLVTRIVAAGAALQAAHELAQTLARGPRSFAYAKRALLRNGLGDVAAALALEAELQGLSAVTSDFDEGLQAFAAKRPPVFRGA